MVIIVSTDRLKMKETNKFEKCSIWFAIEEDSLIISASLTMSHY